MSDSDAAAVAALVLDRLSKEVRINASLRVQLAIARERIDRLERAAKGH